MTRDELDQKLWEIITDESLIFGEQHDKILTLIDEYALGVRLDAYEAGFKSGHTQGVIEEQARRQRGYY